MRVVLTLLLLFGCTQRNTTQSLDQTVAQDREQLIIKKGQPDKIEQSKLKPTADFFHYKTEAFWLFQVLNQHQCPSFPYKV